MWNITKCKAVPGTAVSYSLEPTFLFFLSGTALTITRNALTGKFECRCGRSYSSSHSLLRHKTGCHNTVNAEELSTDETNIEDMQIDSGDEIFESVQAGENQVNCLNFYRSLVLEQSVDSNFFYVQLSAEDKNRIISAFDDLDSQVMNLDQRALNQFFISSNWDAYIESLGDRKALFSLVSLPDADDEYAKVRKYITTYYKTAVGRLHQSNYLLRRWIKNKDGYCKTIMFFGVSDVL